MNIKQIFSKENKEQILKYIYISIFGYGFVFSGLYVLIDVFNIDKSVAFMVVYGISYLFLYTLQLKYLFKTEHNIYKLLRFCGSLVFFYLCANLFYNIGLWFQINYLWATVLSIIILMPLRFLVAKLFVFKS